MSSLYRVRSAERFVIGTLNGVQIRNSNANDLDPLPPPAICPRGCNVEVWIGDMGFVGQERVYEKREVDRLKFLRSGVMPPPWNVDFHRCPKVAR